VNVFPFIAAEQSGDHNVKRACELLEVSRSAYYQQKSGVLSRRERLDAQLIDKITQLHAVSKGTYGAPRIHAELAGAGLRHGRERVARLMRAAGLAGKPPARQYLSMSKAGTTPAADTPALATSAQPLSKPSTASR
jgi:putative transposase